MNLEQLRHNLRQLWLTYYRDNRHWLSQMEVWITYKDQRRPCSSFILATVTVLNPELTQLLPLLADLNPDPDQMVEALGLNFNPERFLGTLSEESAFTGQESATHRLPGAVSTPVEMGRHFFQQRQPEAVTADSVMNARESGQGVGAANGLGAGQGVGDRRSNLPTSDQVLARPPRPIPRHDSNQSTTEITRRANAIDSGCVGRDRTRPRPPRPRRKFLA
ncbi:MAG: DUF5331 domain-containing protein [Cyanobacteria bacterium P01_D01_bin.73]